VTTSTGPSLPLTSHTLTFRGWWQSHADTQKHVLGATHSSFTGGGGPTASQAATGTAEPLGSKQARLRVRTPMESCSGGGWGEGIAAARGASVRKTFGRVTGTVQGRRFTPLWSEIAATQISSWLWWYCCCCCCCCYGRRWCWWWWCRGARGWGGGGVGQPDRLPTWQASTSLGGALHEDQPPTDHRTTVSGQGKRLQGRTVGGKACTYARTHGSKREQPRPHEHGVGWVAHMAFSCAKIVPGTKKYTTHTSTVNTRSHK
jgi:hypothetical protein